MFLSQRRWYSRVCTLISARAARRKDMGLANDQALFFSCLLLLLQSECTPHSTPLDVHLKQRHPLILPQPRLRPPAAAQSSIPPHAHIIHHSSFIIHHHHPSREHVCLASSLTPCTCGMDHTRPKVLGERGGHQ